MTQTEELEAAIKLLDRWVKKRSEKVNKNKVCTCPAQVELDDLKQRLLPQFAGRAERAEKARARAEHSVASLKASLEAFGCFDEKPHCGE